MGGWSILHILGIKTQDFRLGYNKVLSTQQGALLPLTEADLH